MSARSVAVVTGGAGFLGSHLCERLLGLDHEVICIDDLSTGLMSNIAPFMERPNFRFVRHDVQQPLPVETCARIYNFACPASPPLYQRDPIATLRTCVLGACHALDLARRTGARALQASTSEVYGDPDVHPQTEEYFGSVNCTSRRACYDEGKRAAESLFYDYHRQHGVEIRVARIFNTYGPRMNPEDGRVIPNFITQALTGASLTIYGAGRQTRSFCYVDDTVDAFIRLMELDGSRVGPLNIGNPVEFTIRELADRVLKLTGSESDVIDLPLPDDDPKIRRPDIGKARSMLDWNPTVMLDEGLERTIDWYRRFDLSQIRPAVLPEFVARAAE